MPAPSDDGGRPAIDASTILLWLLVVFVGLGLYLYWINILWTLLIVLIISLLLGLLTLSLISDEDEAHEA